MKANRDISRRLSFDAFAQLYDVARPRLGVSLTGELLAFARISSGARVLEVGAGTGQWIDALLAHGCLVEALEPGDQMRALIQRRFGDRVVTYGGDFEHFEGDQRGFDAVLASNAFHWVDPTVGYERTRAVLKADGVLLFVWHFVTTGDDERINGVIAECVPESHRELSTLLGIRSNADEWLDEGRDELRASGEFSEPRWQWFEEPIHHDATSLVNLLASYASDCPMDADERDESSKLLAQRLAADDLSRMRNRIYAVTASPIRADRDHRDDGFSTRPVPDPGTGGPAT